MRENKHLTVRFETPDNRKNYTNITTQEIKYLLLVIM